MNLFFVVGPTVVGLLLGYIYQRQILTRLVQRIGLNLVTPLPSAWDAAFGRIQDRPWTWIVVTTHDDRKIYGLFGGGSLASGDPDNRDIYIEHIADEAFRLEEREHGIWIAASEIKFVELIPD
ncbi:DUF6338 family protein [Roseospira goensis]|uniref:Uncharacterized protein n=1 Tax=Roseospira goensis TaxID=391922 RepID=A0A7W6RYM9_9PROT|nr:hypothetical protein [Roseospira goensis]